MNIVELAMRTYMEKTGYAVIAAVTPLRIGEMVPAVNVGVN